MFHKGSTTLPLFGFLLGVVVLIAAVTIATPEAVDDSGLASKTAEKGAVIRDLGLLGGKVLWILALLGFFKFIVLDLLFKNLSLT